MSVARKSSARITQIAASADTLYALGSDGKVYALVNIDDGWTSIPSELPGIFTTDASEPTAERPNVEEWTDKNPFCGRIACGLASPHTHRGGR